MSLTATRALKKIGFEFGGTIKVYRAGQIGYQPREDREDWQLSATGQHDQQVNFVDMRFTVFVGYVQQQLNAFSSHTLSDGTVINGTGPTGVVDLLNALMGSATADVFFYPALETGSGVDMTKYRVLSRNDEINLLETSHQGIFSPYIPISFIARTPLTAYPTWANR